MKKTLSLGIIFTLTGLLLGIYVMPVFSKENTVNYAEHEEEEAQKNYDLLIRFGDIIDIIKDEYVDEPDMEKIMDEATKSLVASLDPHSEYLNAKKYKQLLERTSGAFGGLGIRVQMLDGLVEAVKVLEGTPAERAGIKDNDLISKIDETEVKGLTIGEAVDLMRGEVGEPIELLVKRAGEAELIKFNLNRDIIQTNPVEFERIGDIGYIYLSDFSSVADERVAEAIEELTEEIGDELNGFILDLRGNGGGLLNQAVYVADLFLEQGEITSTRGRYQSQTQRFNSETPDMTKGQKLVILINGDTASSSEIVAGALQDYKRATIIGTRSFGKGSVQTIRPLDNQEGALRLTTARYYTPSGKSIQAQGIVPDWVVEPIIPEELQKRFEENKDETNLKGYLKNEESSSEDEKKTQSPSYVPRNKDNDLQLVYALKFLNDEVKLGEKLADVEDRILKDAEAEWAKLAAEADAKKEAEDKDTDKP